MPPWAIKTVIALVAAALGFGGGVVYADHAAEKEREKLAKENQRLRQQLSSVLATFKAYDGVMKNAISNILLSPPRSLVEMTIRLRAAGLDEHQVREIVDAVGAAGVYRSA